MAVLVSADQSERIITICFLCGWRYFFSFPIWIKTDTTRIFYEFPFGQILSYTVTKEYNNLKIKIRMTMETIHFDDNCIIV